MQEAETQRKGEVYREIKAGAVFEGIPERPRWELVPGVFVDEAGPIQDVARRLSAQEGDALALRPCPTVRGGPSAGGGDLGRGGSLVETVG